VRKNIRETHFPHRKEQEMGNYYEKSLLMLRITSFNGWDCGKNFKSFVVVKHEN
jgi:hypothetical protein